MNVAEATTKIQLIQKKIWSLQLNVECFENVQTCKSSSGFSKLFGSRPRNGIMSSGIKPQVLILPTSASNERFRL